MPNPLAVGSIEARPSQIAGLWQGFAHKSAAMQRAQPSLKGAAMSASLSPFAASLNVALGGAIGALLRYQLGRGITHWLGPQVVTAFPWATLAANVMGSLAMGLLAGWLARHGSGQGEQMRLLLGVGLLGGFTTFSAFSLELMLLIERGQATTAFTYAAVSVLAGLVALYLGLIVMRVAG